jgi:lipopolysaccharide transport system ATP-binding protein
LQEQNVGDFAIRVSNLSKCYQIYDTPRDRLKQFIAPWVQRVVKHTPKPYFSEFWALRDVSFNIKRGETVGIIGRNGSGKSTLLQLICGTLTPTSGRVETNGRIAALLELGSGFNPEFTGRENVYMNGRILGLSQEEINDCFDDIAAFADIGEFIEQPVKTYSSGMFVRLAFAVQAHIDAQIVIVDEALAVGDVFFRQKCYARLNKLRESGTAILLVSHAMGDIEQFCEYAILLEIGRAHV